MDEKDLLEQFKDENFEDNDFDIKDKSHSKLKKIFVVLGGIFLILMMISFVFVSYPISDIIRGQLESNPIKGNKIILDDFTIVLNNGTNEQLQDIYKNEQKVEFSICLIGTKDQTTDDYYITSLYEPPQQAIFNQVSFQSCSNDTLIMLHSHPYKSCLASETDLNTLKNSQEDNPNMLMVIMCQPDRFSVYS
ncbi:MAG: hypothetical protein ABIH82_05120 [Candidatus Woesearchaeota archaeon]